MTLTGRPNGVGRVLVRDGHVACCAVSSARRTSVDQPSAVHRTGVHPYVVGPRTSAHRTSHIVRDPSRHTQSVTTMRSSNRCMSLIHFPSLDSRLTAVLHSLDAIAHPRCVEWGEIGLDYYYDNSPRDVQQHIFARQLCETVKLGKLLMIGIGAVTCAASPHEDAFLCV
jgi:Tat protein secretion system quality control protein TatD with DNase activity